MQGVGGEVSSLSFDCGVRWGAGLEHNVRSGGSCSLRGREDEDVCASIWVAKLGYVGGAAQSAAVLLAQLGVQNPCSPWLAILEHWCPRHVVGQMGGVEVSGSSPKVFSMGSRV